MEEKKKNILFVCGDTQKMQEHSLSQEAKQVPTVSINQRERNCFLFLFLFLFLVFVQLHV